MQNLKLEDEKKIIKLAQKNCHPLHGVSPARTVHPIVQRNSFCYIVHRK